MGEHSLATPSLPTAVLNQISHVSQKSALKKEIKLWDKTGV